jgi:hypothetical protein
MEGPKSFELYYFVANTNLSFGTESIVMEDLAEAYPYMKRAKLSYKITFSTLSVTSTIIGLFLKSFIFGFLRSPSEVANSINAMIFMQQCYRLCMAIYYLWFSLAYLLPFSLEDMFGGRFCPFFTAIVAFSMFGDIFWGASLAFIRFLYIEHNKLIK